MRDVAFSVLGGVGGSTEAHGTLADLLASVPDALSARLVPPLRVVNDLLGRGGLDAGMSGGCRWEPFEITQAEWEELAGHLKALSPRKRCRVVEPPAWVETIEDWNTWILIFEHGYPEELRHLMQASATLQHEYRQALKDGSPDRAEALYVRLGEADAKLSELVMTHRRKKGT